METLGLNTFVTVKPGLDDAKHLLATSTKVRNMIEPALEHAYGEIQYQDLQQMVAREQVQVWFVFNSVGDDLVAVATTQVVGYPQFKALRVITLGGVNMSQWARSLDDALIDFAKENGCRRMEAFGRKGLAHKLEELAFTVMYTAYGKELE